MYVDGEDGRLSLSSSTTGMMMYLEPPETRLTCRLPPWTSQAPRASTKPLSLSTSSSHKLQPSTANSSPTDRYSDCPSAIALVLTPSCIFPPVNSVFSQLLQTGYRLLSTANLPWNWSCAPLTRSVPDDTSTQSILSPCRISSRECK